MKISRITAWQVDLPLHEGAYNWSGGKSVTVFDSTIVAVQTDSGLTGWGEACPLGPAYLASYASGVSYPVVYMQDGQNLSDPATAFSGTWELDSVLEEVAGRGIEAIVVGVHHAGDGRLAEYSPVPDRRHGGGKADDYLAFLEPRLREAYRAAMRAAGERALETLQNRLASKVPEVAAAAAEFLGLTGSPQAVQLLIGISRHADERVREAALLGLAELGGREVSRPAMPALKDESVLVRMAAARAIAAAGDAGATTVLIRRLEQETDEGVLAALLKAIGQLGAKEALEILAKHAEPGGRPRRTPYVRAAAIEGLARLDRPEARALLELYTRDKEPTVKRAAEASQR